MGKKIYILSGLGADERVFKNLKFEEYTPIFISWIIPFKNETIEASATRLLAQITQKNPVILGLSFGGMIAIEIAKQIKTEKIILISSAKSKYEIPFYFRLVGKTGLHKLLPTSILKSSNFLTNWFFGIQNPKDKKLLKNILKETDPVFLKWAMDKIANWENETQIKETFHLHGNCDRILPAKFIDCNVEIKNGGHLMVFNHADEINLILKNKSEAI